jgi:hypothetical protein
MWIPLRFVVDLSWNTLTRPHLPGQPMPASAVKQAGEPVLQNRCNGHNITALHPDLNVSPAFKN